MTMANEVDAVSVDTIEHLQPVLPRLFIGDFQASQSVELLTAHRIKYIVSAMKQTYKPAPGVEVMQVSVDDTDKTNIIEWFDKSGDFIKTRLEVDAESCVLVHCAAGISRSTTLVAAYLMREEDLSLEDAISLITSRRPQVQPTEFFMYQLEMYERHECEWDPSKHQEQRRFVMGFMANDMRNGDGTSKLILAYYPSPAPSPRARSTSDPFRFGMTPLTTTDSETSPPPSGSGPMAPNVTPAVADPPRRQRLTKRAPAKVPQPPPPRKAPEVEKLGQGRVVIHGRRLRCKMCRRELAARDHIVAHEPGQGQSAFAPQKRDIALYRRETLDKLKERSEAIVKEAIAAQARAAKGVETSVADTVDHGGELDVDPAAPLAADTTMKFEPSPPPQDESRKVPVTENRLPGLAQLGVSMPVPIAHTHSGNIIHASPMATPSPSSYSPSSPPLVPHQACSSYFIEPLSWMEKSLSGDLAGKLVCPGKRCGAKLGGFDWAGLQCSCGAWVTPGFQLLRSKVDEISL